MEIVYKSKRFIVINKPYGMPSQKDPSGDVDAMSETERFLRENGERSDLWLVHRLDRVVSGLMVFARTKESAAALSKAIQDRLFKKVYLAVVEGECPDSGEMHDLLFKDSNSSKAFIVDRKRTGVKEASLSYRTIARTDVEKRTLSLVSVILDTGRFHQIRSQFSHRKMPLVGDGKYGSTDKGRRTPALFSAHLSFSLDGETLDVSLKPNKDEYPWNLWGDKL